MRRWIGLAVALLVAGLVLFALRGRPPATAPEAPEIDEASKQALREILRQEEE